MGDTDVSVSRSNYYSFDPVSDGHWKVDLRVRGHNGHPFLMHPIITPEWSLYCTSNSESIWTWIFWCCCVCGGCKRNHITWGTLLTWCTTPLNDWPLINEMGLASIGPAGASTRLSTRSSGGALSSDQPWFSRLSSSLLQGEILATTILYHHHHHHPHLSAIFACIC